MPSSSNISTRQFTFFHTDGCEKQTVEPIAEEAARRGYAVRFTEDMSELADIGVYCQHACRPNANFSVIMLHDLAQRHDIWPNFWHYEPWNRFDIGLLPGKSWEDRWQVMADFPVAKPKIGVFNLGWPKADIPLRNRDQFNKAAAKLRHSLGLKHPHSILYAPSWENDNKQDEFVKAFIDLPVNLLLKQAPWSDAYPAVLENIRRMNELHRDCAPNVHIIDPNISIMYCLGLADAIVSDESSVLTEALLLDVPSVAVEDWLIPDTMPPRPACVPYDYVEKTTRAKLRGAVMAILDDKATALATVRDARDQHFSFLGKSAAAILDTIEAALHGNPLPHAPCFPQVELDRELCAKAIDWIQNGQRDAGINTLLELASKNTPCWEVFNTLGVLAYGEGMHKDAADLLEAAAGRAPAPQEPLAHLAEIYCLQGDASKASSTLLQYIRSTPPSNKLFDAIRAFMHDMDPNTETSDGLDTIEPSGTAVQGPMAHSYDAARNLWTRPDFTGIAYSDGSEIEAHLLAIMKGAKDRSVFSEELGAHICDWPTEYHLTTSRHCLLRPVQFSPGESVLELGCGCGAITRYLGELGLNVTAVEGGAKRAEIAAERVRDLSNVKVVFDDLVQFKSSQKYDWVTLIGVLEYSPMFAPGEDPVRAYLQQALSYLKPGGRLIVAIENQLGLKYFNGCGEDHVGHPFFGPQGLYEPKGPVTFGKKQLRQRLLDTGFSEVDFFYPFPDYKIPQAIVSEAAFSDEKFRVADMLLRIDARDYGGRNLRLFSEQLVARVLEDNGILSDFSNSFLAIAALAPTSRLNGPLTLAWCFSLNRRPQYRTETIFQCGADGIEVDKHLIDEKFAGKTAPPGDLEHHTGVVPYATGRLQAWGIFQAKLRPYSEQALARAFLPYLQLLLSRSQVPEGANPELLESWQTPGTLIDLTPFNAVDTESGPVAIDMEWSLAGLVPTGWILLRSLIHTLLVSGNQEATGESTLGSLMSAITGPVGMRYSASSFKLWGEFEQEFLAAATGKKISLAHPDVSLNGLGPLRIHNIDRPGYSAAKTITRSAPKNIVIDSSEASAARTRSLAELPSLPVSIVLISYQQENYILEAIAGILSQDYPVDEIIISDDGSSDRTFDAICSMEGALQAKCKHLVLRQNPENIGIIPHFNVAFGLARNDLIVYCAGDDISEPNRTRRLVESYQNSGFPRYCLIHSNVITISSSGTLGTVLVPPVIEQELDFKAIAYSTRLHIGATAAFTRALWADYGKFEHNWVYEDLVLGWRACMHEQYHYIDETLVRYRDGGVSTKDSTAEELRRFHIALGRQRLEDTIAAEAAGVRDDLTEIRESLLATLRGCEKTYELSESDKAYSDWQGRRRLIPEDRVALDRAMSVSGSANITIQFIVRVAPGDETLLANTLDALSLQFDAKWQLGVFTTLPAPEGMEEIPNISWNTVESFKEAIDKLVADCKLDLVVEIPPGAKPDPLFVLRLCDQATRTPEAMAFFVDDDSYDPEGYGRSPRFKPGVNPAAMLSTDLAGPLCIRREAWLASGGAGANNESPWFAQLLKLVEHSGWQSLRHIPDILISYPETYPANPQLCIDTLSSALSAAVIDAEIIPATKTSWRVRYALGSAPGVTVAIISRGQLGLLSRCMESLLDRTRYPKIEILVAISEHHIDTAIASWLDDQEASQSPTIRRVVMPGDGINRAALCNRAARATANDFLIFLDENTYLVQDTWLEELVRTVQQPGIAGVSPLIAEPGTANVKNAGGVLGLAGLIGTPYLSTTKLTAQGYLDCLQVARDVSALPGSCMLVRTKAFLEVGGMDEQDLGNYLQDADLSQKLIAQGYRLIFQPQSIVTHGDFPLFESDIDAQTRALEELSRAKAESAFSQRWLTSSPIDPFWNPNLSLLNCEPTAETAFRAQWQYLPTDKPRILARPVDNGQGAFRVTAPLRALRKAGLASECVWFQEKGRDLTALEILQLNPDTVIAQNYMFPTRLASLQQWHSLPNRPFIVYTLDDLITDLAKSNPFSKTIPDNSGEALKYALSQADRMVVSTDFLAEAYQHLIKDICVVPNRLEQEIWLPLSSKKRTGARPRIGWAGGTTHQGDLILLKEIIEKTRHEADWIFFGMCPDEIRPLLAEYHPLVDFQDYPATLASLNFDIAVAPLAMIPFNQGKSNLRLLEYGALGIPVVCTDIDPYRGTPACCVGNSPEAWTEALRARIHDADAREQEGMAMRKWVHKHYLLENHLEDWLKAHLPG